MTDPRYTQLAETLIRYSCALEEGENLLIEAIDVPHDFTRELVRVALSHGVRPQVTLRNQAVNRSLLVGATEEQFALQGELEAERMSRMQAYIGIRGSENVSELSDVPAGRMALYETHIWKKVHAEIRVPKTRWVVLRWPNSAMAQLAQMSTEAFENFYFDVCNVDYELMSRAMGPLKALMERTDRVRLIAPGTDLAFSIKDIPAIRCDGHRNIPDGEVFTAPVRDSIEGTIQYNTPTLYHGVTHEDVRLVFAEGKVVEATSSQTKHLNQVLDADEGARYVGEFAIGFHPKIEAPMKDILFDEKIAGSIHLTPGQAYEEAWNGNASKIHWDLILRMDPAAGGGEVWFDDVLIRKDGRFVLDELEGLNPENLTT